MARWTPDRDALMIRLVYDGPPRSGKTTSLRALAGGMARAVVSPAESAGRTLYFDWLEYVGGSFEGVPIHCQILSVPGQRELTARRFALLGEADAVVFVTGGSPEHLPGAAAHLRELRAFLASRPAPRPGVVVQANQRDRSEALPVPALGAALDLDGLALVESVATENQGIRQAFVLAVRLALDRVREMIALGRLPEGAGETDDPEALRVWLEAAERGAAARPAPLLVAHEKPAGAPPGRPRLPDGSAPSGRVWPPVDGRIVLHSAAAPGAVPFRVQDGSWRLSTGAWHFHSAARHEFDQLDDAKEELLVWAQRHAGSVERLSAQRCLTLADTGWGTWRLWQVVRAEESLRQRLQAALRECAPAAAASLLRACAARLLEARSAFREAPRLPCRLEVIGERQGRAVYIGRLPPAGWEPAADEYPDGDAALVRREIQPLVAAALRQRGWPEEELIAELRLHSMESPQAPAVAEVLSAVLAEG